MVTVHQQQQLHQPHQPPPSHFLLAQVLSMRPTLLKDGLDLRSALRSKRSLSWERMKLKIGTKLNSDLLFKLLLLSKKKMTTKSVFNEIYLQNLSPTDNAPVVVE